MEQTKRCEYFPDVVSDRVSDRVDALLKGAAVWRKEAVTRVYAEKWRRVIPSMCSCEPERRFVSAVCAAAESIADLRNILIG